MGESFPIDGFIHYVPEGPKVIWSTEGVTVDGQTEERVLVSGPVDISGQGRVVVDEPPAKKAPRKPRPSEVTKKAKAKTPEPKPKAVRKAPVKPKSDTKPKKRGKK